MNYLDGLLPAMTEHGWKLGLLVLAALVVPRVITALRQRILN